MLGRKLSSRKRPDKKSLLFNDVTSVEDVVLEYVVDSGWKDYKRFGRILTESILKKRPRSRTELEDLVYHVSHPFFIFNGVTKKEFASRFPLEDLLRESSIPRNRPLARRSTLRRKALPKRLRFLVLERDGFRCQLCGKTAKETKLEVDHKVAAAKGGTDSLNNLWTLCEDCNRGKSDLTVSLD